LATLSNNLDTVQSEGSLRLPWQFLLITLVYTLSLLVVASALRVQYGFPLDDSYIHQTVARNLATYGIPGFEPGQRSSGTTSILWTCIQAANYAFLSGIDPVLYNLCLSWALLVLIGSLLHRLAHRDGMRPLSCWILAVTPALCGNFIWLGLIGMEHLLFTALTLAAIYFWYDDESRTRRRTAIFAGLCAGLLAVTRPEAMIFAPLLIVARPKRLRGVADFAALLGIWSIFVVAVFGVNLYTSHGLMPATMEGRSWLYFHTSGGPHTLHSLLRFAGSWIMRLPRQFSTGFVTQLTSVTQFDSEFSLLGLLLAALGMLGAYALIRQRPARINFLLLWALLHFCTYMATFPSAGHGGRYQPLNLLLLFPLLCFGLLWLFERVAASDARWPRFAVVVLALLGGAASLNTWRTVTIDGIGHINDTHAQIGEWMIQHLPPNAKIAAFDIGRVSYLWQRGIIDLGALVDPSYTPYLISGRVPEYVEQKEVEYLVLPDDAAAGFGFLGDRSLKMTLLARFCSPVQPWLIGFRYTIHAGRCQEIYRLSYPDTVAGNAGH
jgi:hypothetical protein